MARNRQRAKQRQAERRERRLAQPGTPGEGPATPKPAPARGDEALPPEAERQSGSAGPGVDDARPSNPAPGIFPDVAAGAPPEETGRSDQTIRDEPELSHDPELEAEAEAEAIREIEDWETEPRDASDRAEADEPYAPRGRRGEETEKAKNRPRVIQFLLASRAELQRVQWPNRQALTTLTGVVLGFVLIAGGYLGLLDAIFSRIIQAIL